jgi:hypothetical protein
MDHELNKRDALVYDFILNIDKKYFSRQEVLSYSDEFKKVFRNDSTDHHISNGLCSLRDQGIIKFLDNKGNYELIEKGV